MKKMLLASLFVASSQLVACSSGTPAYENKNNNMSTETNTKANAEISTETNAATSMEETSMEETMAVMGKNFKKIAKAKNTAEMEQPVKALAKYAKQAEVLAASAPADIRTGMQEGFTKLNADISALQTLVDKGDYEAAKALHGKINEHRKKYHKLYK